MSHTQQYLTALKMVIDNIDCAEVDETIELLAKAKEEGRQIFVIGNGGSAGSSSHFVTDMAKGAYNKDMTNFKITSLCDNVCMMTALGNDFGYEDIFTGQLRNVFNQGDILIAISASGNSPNVIKAIEYANSNGGTTIGLSGFSGGKLKELSSKCLHIPFDHYGLVEDAHMIICHVLAYYFMERSGNMKSLAESIK